MRDIFDQSIMQDNLFWPYGNFIISYFTSSIGIIYIWFTWYYSCYIVSVLRFVQNHSDVIFWYMRLILIIFCWLGNLSFSLMPVNLTQYRGTVGISNSRYFASEFKHKNLCFPSRFYNDFVDCTSFRKSVILAIFRNYSWYYIYYSRKET